MSEGKEQCLFIIIEPVSRTTSSTQFMLNRIYRIKDQINDRALEFTFPFIKELLPDSALNSSKPRPFLHQRRPRPFPLNSAPAYASLAPIVVFFFALLKAGTSSVRRDVLYVWSDWPWVLGPASPS